MSNRGSNRGKSVQLAKLFSAKIRRGEWKAGEKLDSISVLFERYETTAPTLSRTFDILENQGLLDRYAGKGCYVRKLSGLRYGLVFDGKCDEGGNIVHKSVFLKIFHQFCQEHNAQYTVFNRVDDERSAQDLIRKLKENAFDVLLVSSRYFAEYSQKLSDELTIPFIGLYSYKWLKTSVSFNFGRFIYQAGRYLADRGCKPIYLFYNADENFEWSYNAGMLSLDFFRDMLACAGHFYHPGLLKECHLSIRSAYENTLALLQKHHNDRIGIISSDSLLTIGIQQAAAEAGFFPPDNFLLASHVNEDSPLGEFPYPLITGTAMISEQIALIAKLANAACNGDDSIIGHHDIELVFSPKAVTKTPVTRLCTMGK